MNVYTALRMADDLSSRMLDALHFYAKTNPQGSTARTNNGRGGGTHGALVRRGLVGLGVDANGRAGYFLTPKAWAFLRAQYGTMRPADDGRLDLDQALAEAYPAEQTPAPAAPRAGEVVVPGALADHLTAEAPADADTRATLDDARRGRGRTLIIKPRTVAVLHTISRAAEHLLDIPGTTRAQRAAARQWIERAGHAPNPVQDDDQAAAELPSFEALAVTVACPTCHVSTGARCVTRAGKPAREPHGRRVEALEQAAGITEHRATARRDAQARGYTSNGLDHKAEAALLTAYAARIKARDAEQALAAEAHLDQVEAEVDEQFDRTARAVDAVEHAEQVEAAVEIVEDAEALYAAQLVTEAEATEGTWQGAWIGEHQAADALFDVDRAAEQGALFEGRAAH
ncbi:hypothetical protein [Streptomyces sp. NPDC050546]|uniref:zinc finger domain-containing protein n=1 Tax=Streptomyces sp. NPDC050546 TaxID=3365628 RepID=UPI0037A452FF